MSEENKSEKNFSFYKYMHILLTIALFVVFIFSLFPMSNIIIDNNKLIFLTFLVVLILAYRFNDIQIPGFLKLTKTLESVKKETEELKNTLLQISLSLNTISQSTAQSSANINISLLGQEAKAVSERLETKAPKSKPKLESKTDDERVIEYFDEGDYVAAFSILRRMLENVILKICKNNKIEIFHQNLASLSNILLKKEIIDYDLYDAIQIVRQVTNQFIHASTEVIDIDHTSMKYILNVGIKAYYKLKNLAEEEFKNIYEVQNG